MKKNQTTTHTKKPHNRNTQIAVHSSRLRKVTPVRSQKNSDCCPQTAQQSKYYDVPVVVTVSLQRRTWLFMLCLRIKSCLLQQNSHWFQKNQLPKLLKLLKPFIIGYLNKVFQKTNKSNTTPTWQTIKNPKQQPKPYKRFLYLTPYTSQQHSWHFDLGNYRGLDPCLYAGIPT